MNSAGPSRVGILLYLRDGPTSSEEGELTAHRTADLFGALVEEVRASEALLLLAQSPPRETDSFSITVGAEKKKERPRLTLTFEPDSGQLVLQGVYWRSGEFTPGMRERHGLLFNPVTLRLDDQGYGFSDPRQAVPEGETVELECFGTAREAAGFLLRLLEHFHGMVDERSD